MTVQAVLKTCYLKGRGTCFTCDYSSQMKRDKYTQAKQVPRPLISEFFDCSLSRDNIAHER